MNVPPQRPGSGLPEALAEYGRLAARLPETDPAAADRLRARLAELDELIDRQVGSLPEGATGPGDDAA
ncbi:hypothetical protein IQ251_12300 [Saccharopolyspora sp. HNM0983]|uniref:Uncharacterized protein n=1 Tax=Saccharopolyspora montiporae TaxID=2781240 RepID=A0A929BAK0_9PSEU|nr:hypothetical protein [Saccharopolyspora sp. HNM0983]MBE9375225.1 hypothetical protein [Saccharopolyspora sp. HNM0983]